MTHKEHTLTQAREIIALMDSGASSSDPVKAYDRLRSLLGDFHKEGRLAFLEAKSNLEKEANLAVAGASLTLLTLMGLFEVTNFGTKVLIGESGLQGAALETFRHAVNVYEEVGK